MGTKKPSTESPSERKASFGSGLGADFKPLGRRILVQKGRDARPLKVKSKQARDENEC